MGSYLRKVFTVDLRALALMRIWLAGIVLTDLAIRATDLEAHYADTGVLPLHALHQHAWHQYFFSFHAFSGLWQFQAVLFAVAAVCATSLLVGYKTRFATIATWLLLISLQNRNVLIAQGGDDLLRMLLFWGIFLPWGRFYSYDAAKASTPATETRYFSAATAAYILQLFLLYVCAALLKNSPEWNSEGTALYYALSLDQILMPLGKLIYPYPELLRLLTLGTYYTELLLPFLLLIPFYNAFFRLLVAGVLVLLHIGISLTLFVGLFYLISIASVTGLLPANAMDWIEQRFLSSFKRPFSGQFKRVFREISFPVTVRVELQWPRTFLQVARQRQFREVFVGVMLFYSIWWNISETNLHLPKLPEHTKWLGILLRTDQRWGMFAPVVFKDDGWYVLEGSTTAGKTIDLNQKGKEADYAKPASVMAMFKNDRWRKYSENYLFISNSAIRPYYCHYLLRQWNEQHPDQQVTKLHVVYMKEPTRPGYQTVKPKREMLCACATAKE
ncbi:hypothetical protein [Botryobacter ruber]|uniref:hypothetical protein n=1 Tax=Botryobacter ruber TaxID=2171629 RepID=UPI0037431BCC